MNNIFIKSFFLLSLLSLAACSSTKSPQRFSPATVDNDMAVIYIFRPAVMANAIYSPDLYINGELKMALKSGRNTRLVLSPGETKLEIDPDEHYSGLTSLTLQLKPGSRHYIRVDSTLKISDSVSYEPYQRSFNLINVDEQLAINQISNCCMASSKSDSESPLTEPVKQHRKDEFSVDKTQNPFSH